MKWAVAAVAAAILLAVGGLVVAVVGTRDTVPGELKDCLREAGVRPARGPEALGPLRRDAEAGRALRGTTRKVGDDELLVIEQPDYALVILTTPDNPKVAADQRAARVALDPTPFSVVALARGPLKPVVSFCADKTGP